MSGRSDPVPRFCFAEPCPPADEASLVASLYQHNALAVGVDDGRPLASIVREADGGAIVAGVIGSTWAGTCAIDVLWVRADRRGHGLGRALLRGAEEEARRRGCQWVTVDTYTFQAPDLYRQEGYDVVAEIADSPCVPHRHLYLRKRLPQA